MSIVIVAGTIPFASREARNGAVKASVDLQRCIRTDEPGCLAYSFAADPADQTVVQVLEIWADEAALAAHFQHPNFVAMREMLRNFPRRGSSAVAKYRCDATEPVHGPDGVPRATFGG